MRRGRRPPFCKAPSKESACRGASARATWRPSCACTAQSTTRASSATERPRYLRDQALVEFWYACGARISESSSLLTRDVRLRARAGALVWQRRKRAHRAAPSPRAREHARVRGRGAPRLVDGKACPYFFVVEPRQPVRHRLHAQDVQGHAPCRRRRHRDSPRTTCATRSQATCWKAAPTCAASRRCLVTQPFDHPDLHARPPSTAWQTCTAKRIREDRQSRQALPSGNLILPSNHA